jgi:HPt (histidine-containing phosphotransfer) domain-containing protein
MIIPDELVQQFRVVAMQRVDRVVAAWGAISHSADEVAAQSMHRELHTLKGESRMLGFTDVNLVCHKLEDLLELARVHGYAVDEDFDLAVHGALRCMAMLIRKELGAQLVGIDLPGLVHQIDGLLAEVKPERSVRANPGAPSPSKSAPAAARVPAAIRARLAPVAVDAFIEYATAHGLRRDRLRGSWHGLRDLIGIQRAIVGAGQLAKHKAAALSLARELGKMVEVSLELEAVEVTTEMLAAIDAATLHLVRSAVEHGIERPSVRMAAGKPERGQISVRCALQQAHVVLVVEDDGCGVSTDEVRAPASGPDAVRSGIVDASGSLTETPRPGAGTTWIVTIPVPRLAIRGAVLDVPGVPFPCVIEDTWTPTTGTPGAPVVDVAAWLGLAGEAQAPTPRYFERDGQRIGIASQRAPLAIEARRIIEVPQPAVAEVVALDRVEGLLLHLDRLIRS